VNHCQSNTISGKECDAPVMNGEDYCYRHNPRISKQDKVDASKQGGKRFKVLQNAPEASIKSIQSILILLEQNINDVRKGRVDPRVSNAVVQNVNAALKVYELAVIESRINILESKAGIDNQPRPISMDYN